MSSFYNQQQADRMHLNYLMMVNHERNLLHHDALRRAEALDPYVTSAASRAAAAEKLLGAATAMAALASSPAKKATGGAAAEPSTTTTTAGGSRRASTVSLDGTDSPSAPRSLLPQPPRVLEATYQLTQDDIIMGRHKLAFNHIGNRRFRALVTDSLPKYFQFPRRDQRSRLIQEIIQLVESSGGQFLKFNPAMGGRWVELDSTEKRNKVGHALRDTASSAKMAKKRFHVKEPVPPFVPKQQQASLAKTTTAAAATTTTTAATSVNPLHRLAATASSRQRISDIGLAYSLADVACGAGIPAITAAALPVKNSILYGSESKISVGEGAETAAKRPSAKVDMDLLMSLPYFAAKKSEKEPESHAV